MTTQPTAPALTATDPAAPDINPGPPAWLSVPAYWLWRVACLVRALIDGGDIRGCCTCGGTSSTWRYWGATDLYADWPAGLGRPPADWHECDRCHAAYPAGDWMLALEHERRVRPLAVRAFGWALTAVAVLGIIGAIFGASPLLASLAAVSGLVLAAVGVASLAADIRSARAADAAVDDADPAP